MTELLNSDCLVDCYTALLDGSGERARNVGHLNFVTVHRATSSAFTHEIRRSHHAPNLDPDEPEAGGDANKVNLPPVLHL